MHDPCRYCIVVAHNISNVKGRSFSRDPHCRCLLGWVATDAGWDSCGIEEAWAGTGVGWSCVGLGLVGAGTEVGWR